MSTARMRSSRNPGENYSPSELSQGRIDKGLENIQVSLLAYPNEEQMVSVLMKGSRATIGTNVSDKYSNPDVAELLLKGGLRNILEAGSYVFEISGISRAATHQIVRTRGAAFIQQSMRFVEMKNFNVRMPESIAEYYRGGAKMPVIVFERLVKAARKAYDTLIEYDIPYEDARYVLPIGTETYIVGTYPIKVWMDTYTYRACPMFQDEIRYVFVRMKEEITKVNPWIAKEALISCEKTKRCTFQGMNTEDTTGCDFPWAADKVFGGTRFE